MKQLLSAIIVCSLVTITACSKKSDSGDSGDPNNPSGISVEVDGLNIAVGKSEDLLAMYAPPTATSNGYSSLVIGGDEGKKYVQVTVSFKNKLTTGQYPMKNNGEGFLISSIAYTEDEDAKASDNKFLWSNTVPEAEQTGSVVITKLDNDHVEGTYTAVVINYSAQRKTVKGKFNVKITKSEDPLVAEGFVTKVDGIELTLGNAEVKVRKPDPSNPSATRYYSIEGGKGNQSVIITFFLDPVTKKIVVGNYPFQYGTIYSTISFKEDKNRPAEDGFFYSTTTLNTNMQPGYIAITKTGDNFVEGFFLGRIRSLYGGKAKKISGKFKLKF